MNMPSQHAGEFLTAAGEWICEPYSLIVQYIALGINNSYFINNATIKFWPLPSDASLTFKVELPNIHAGQVVLNNISKTEAISIIHGALQGQITVHEQTYTLAQSEGINHWSDINETSKWIFDLVLKISGDPARQIDYFASLEKQLRKGPIPFDGLTDLAAWLSLKDPRRLERPEITVSVNPPVAIDFPRSGLMSDTFQCVLEAHKQLDKSSISLSVISHPSKGMDGRKQISEHLEWDDSPSDRKFGRATITLPAAESILSILTVRETTVQRQWFLDPIKARNSRYVATNLFDRDLKRIRLSLEGNDQNKFEIAAGNLLFLMGFSPAIQLETEGPDLIVMTPGGKVILVECTLKISDVATKIGKLVDRRESLSSTLKSSSHFAQVSSVLICALPRENVAARIEELKSHQIILVTKDEINTALEQIRTPIDPDAMIDNALATLNQGIN